MLNVYVRYIGEFPIMDLYRTDEINIVQINMLDYNERKKSVDREMVIEGCLMIYVHLFNNIQPVNMPLCARTWAGSGPMLAASTQNRPSSGMFTGFLSYNPLYLITYLQHIWYKLGHFALVFV